MKMGSSVSPLMVETTSKDGSEAMGHSEPVPVAPKQNMVLINSAYMAVFAILGAAFRILFAQLFGDECANPGTVGWLAASSPLCVTADGQAVREGGIIFADLPANMIGSFIMGMMQTTAALGLPGSIPIAWTSVDSWFQGCDVIHLAIRTGFCGSLTTFSSWNSAMVVLLFGTGTDFTVVTQILRTLFGYIIGMETALGSFVFGKKVAEWFYRWKDPELAVEGTAASEKEKQGVYINPKLPTFERRFLPDLDIPGLDTGIEYERLDKLCKWRHSTENARRVGHGDLHHLNEIEETLLVQKDELPKMLEEVAIDRGWDLQSLLFWTRGAEVSVARPTPNNSFLFTNTWSIIIIFCVYLLLGTALVLIKHDQSTYDETYRTMVYSLLLAPLGALLRWYLSGFNGKWLWVPAGTLAANIIGSMVSITAISLEYVSPVKGFWRISTLRAIKVGFSGSLTTVSTFVAEVHGFSQERKTQDKSYLYIVSTLVSACAVASIIYASICHPKLFDNNN